MRYALRKGCRVLKSPPKVLTSIQIIVVPSEGTKCSASYGSCAPECTARGLDRTFEIEPEVKEGKSIL